MNSPFVKRGRKRLFAIRREPTTDDLHGWQLKWGYPLEDGEVSYDPLAAGTYPTKKEAIAAKKAIMAARKERACA